MFPETYYFIYLSEIYSVIKKFISIFMLVTGLGAMKPAIGLNRINGPHKIARTIAENKNPIKHLSSIGIGSPMTF